MKLYEVIKGAYRNYNVMLDSQTRDKFLDFMKETLETLATLLEVIAFADIGKVFSYKAQDDQ